MPCYRPITAYHVPGGGITFKRSESSGRETQLPCGKCIGCRNDYARSWAVRCVHEAQITDELDGRPSSFLTLTYSNDKLPHGATLVPEHLRDFIKRLRKKVGHRISYFACGEYGDQLGRPHYHMLLFGHDFSEDRELWSKSRENPLYTSNTLNAVWNNGYCVIGDVTFQSAAYTARYTLKKQYGDYAEGYYERHNVLTDEFDPIHPEFSRTSTKPAIGKRFWDKYRDCILAEDCVVLLDGQKIKPPRYYDKLHKEYDEDSYNDLKKRRIETASNDPNNTPERLSVREECHELKFQRLARQLDAVEGEITGE